MSISLGRKPPSPQEIGPAKTEEPKITYPSFEMRDEACDAFVEQFGKPTLGDEIEAPLKLKVTSMTEDEYGKCLRFDVLSMEGESMEEKTGEEPESSTAAEEPAKTKKIAKLNL